MTWRRYPPASSASSRVAESGRVLPDYLVLANLCRFGKGVAGLDTDHGIKWPWLPKAALNDTEGYLPAKEAVIFFVTA